MADFSVFTYFFCVFFSLFQFYVHAEKGSPPKISHANPINTSSSRRCQNKLSETSSEQLYVCSMYTQIHIHIHIHIYIHIHPTNIPPTHAINNKYKYSYILQMKLACNIRWRLRLELQQLHSPKNKCRIECQNIVWLLRGKGGRKSWGEGKTTTGSQAAFVCKPKCMSMKNIFGVRYANMNQK